MDGSDGWEWPVLLLILASYPDSWEGERAAIQEWIDTWLVLRTGDPQQLASVRRFYRQLHLIQNRNGDHP